MARILIADDSFLMRKNLKAIFTQAGHEVIAEAGNGKAAVKAYKDFKPDLVTMDITMPVMTGIEAVKEIISEFPEAKIVMITALDQKHMVFQAINNGAKHYIMKPFNIAQVLSVVNSVLEEVQKKENQEAFSVSKSENEYIVSIKGALSNNDIMLLLGTVQGLLITVNPKITFDLSKNPFVDEILVRIEDIVKKIQEAGGSYSLKR